MRETMFDQYGDPLDEQKKAGHRAGAWAKGLPVHPRHL
jgi:hypothetical protein